MNRVLHFTLGPVQGFVGEARRLRDFWAGSFLLSWLSGRAMRALEDAGGKILLPETAGDPLLRAISAGGTGPKIGSLPNRFKADVGKVQGDAGAICREAVQEAWKGLADAVWDRFVRPVASNGKNTRNIWDRQIGQFWEMAWVTGDAPADGADAAWLDRRKNWRSHWPAEQERSDLCMMMGHFQEISGFNRFGGGEKQKAFWNALRAQRIGPLNLREDERLCAMALIKRLFPLLDEEAQENVLGFKLADEVRNWPSTAYVAALPWLDRLADDRFEKGRKAYAKAAAENLEPGYKGETATTLFNLPKEDFFRLDGQLYFEDGIALQPEDAFRGSRAEHSKALLAEALRKLQKTAGRPSKFYALLIMDGDRIGQKLREDPGRVKEGLARFSQDVAKHFAPPNAHRGALIYAGGDDVLAMLPVDTAIDAAYSLRALYDDAFAKAGNGAADPAYTMSAAIVYAHYKIPLRRVIETAHHQLDTIAKEKNGRDSLALAALKPGGISCEWVSCWKGDGYQPGRLLSDMASDMQSDPEFASGFFHALRARYGPLFETSQGRPSGAPLGDAAMMEALIRYEYAHSGKSGGKDGDGAIRKLMQISQPLGRVGGKIEKAGHFVFDAGLMVRFLAQNGLLPLKAPHKDGEAGND